MTHLYYLRRVVGEIVCGLTFNHKWYIINGPDNGCITCPKCIKGLAKYGEVTEME